MSATTHHDGVTIRHTFDHIEITDPHGTVHSGDAGTLLVGIDWQQIDTRVAEAVSIHRRNIAPTLNEDS